MVFKTQGARIGLFVRSNRASPCPAPDPSRSVRSPAPEGGAEGRPPRNQKIADSSGGGVIEVSVFPTLFGLFKQAKFRFLPTLWECRSFIPCLARMHDSSETIFTLLKFLRCLTAGISCWIAEDQGHRRIGTRTSSDTWGRRQAIV